MRASTAGRQWSERALKKNTRANVAFEVLVSRIKSIKLYKSEVSKDDSWSPCLPQFCISRLAVLNVTSVKSLLRLASLLVELLPK